MATLRSVAVGFGLQKVRAPPYNYVLCVGGIAQLGERLHGMQEVSGSIPLTSTTQTHAGRLSARAAYRRVRRAHWNPAGAARHAQ